MRIGSGFDVHAFGDGDHLMLGGVRHCRTIAGRLAHSDGDVVIHALCDALLGALALGDIGQHFPPTDPRWKDADSREFLRHCGAADAPARLDAGQRRHHRDLRAAEDRPARRGDARDAWPQDLGVDVDQVSVKATTTEKAGLHRSRRRHRRPCGGPAGAGVTDLSFTLPAQLPAGCRVRWRPLDGPLPQRCRGFRVEELASFAADRAGRAPAADGREARHEHRVRGQKLARWAGIAGDGRRLRRHEGPPCGDAPAFLRAPARSASRRTWRLLEADGMPGARAALACRKLPRGALAGNRFALVLREVRGDRVAPIESGCESIRERRHPELFRRAALRPRRRQRRGGAAHVRRRAGAAASSARSCCPRRVRRCSTPCWRAHRSTETGTTGCGRRGLDARWHPERVRSGADSPRNCALARSAGHPSHRAAVGRGRVAHQRNACARSNDGHRDAFAELCAGLEKAGLKQERPSLRVRVSESAVAVAGGRCAAPGFQAAAGLLCDLVLAELGDVNACLVPLAGDNQHRAQAPSYRCEQHQHGARSALVDRRGGERKHVAALAQDAIDQRLSTGVASERRPLPCTIRTQQSRFLTGPRLRKVLSRQFGVGSRAGGAGRARPAR